MVIIHSLNVIPAPILLPNPTPATNLAMLIAEYLDTTP
jgi:hypothetical protein